MTSKQQKAKDEQGYSEKLKNCGTCSHFTSDKVASTDWYGKPFVTVKNKRCGIGGFAVKSLASCNLYAVKVAEEGLKE